MKVSEHFNLICLVCHSYRMERDHFYVNRLRNNITCSFYYVQMARKKATMKTLKMAKGFNEKLNKKMALLVLSLYIFDRI